MRTIIPPPPVTDDCGFTKSERIKLREKAARIAATAMSVSDYIGNGNDVGQRITSAASVVEMWIIKGDEKC